MSRIIGFGNGDFWKLHTKETQLFDNAFLKSLNDVKTNAVELHCRDVESLDFLLQNDIDSLNSFEFISVHALDLAYDDNNDSHGVLQKIEQICIKYNTKNVVFHTDKVQNWDVIAQYTKIPISIENMDDRKPFGRTLEDVNSILEKYDFGLTLDLQHCFVNDATMKLAQDFQKKFKNRIVEYHISGFKEVVLHYPLYKTKQDIIIDSLMYKDVPIIIESVFDAFGEEKDELQYIQKRLK